MSGSYGHGGRTHLKDSPKNPERIHAVDMAILVAAQLFRVNVGPFKDSLSGMPLPVRWAFWYDLIFAIVLLGE